jgi:hypothetical protein
MTNSYSISSLRSDAGNHREQQTVRQSKLLFGGFMFLLVSGSISSNIVINRPEISLSFSSVYQCSIHDFDSRANMEILYDFVSNLINNSEDLDGRIVNMVNEKFWDLI